jgi:hypothetical protein
VDVAKQGMGKEERLLRSSWAWMGRVLMCGEKKVIRVAGGC